MKTISVDILESLFSYDPQSGLITRKTSKPGIFKKGDIVGKKPNPSGYGYVRINGVQFLTHRLIYAMMTGSFPCGEIDHINGNRFDNRWENLRVVDRVTQNRNLCLRSNNKSGVLGVYFRKSSRKFVSYITIGGKQIYLGSFSKIEDASRSRADADFKYGFHQNHGKR